MTGKAPREHRQPVLIHAEMRSDAKRTNVVICNVSSRGLLLSAEEAPRRGSYVEVSRGGVVTAARVVWVDGDKFGVRTSEKIDVDALTGAKGAARIRFLEAERTAARGRSSEGASSETNRGHGALVQFVAIGGGLALAAVVGSHAIYSFLLEVTSSITGALD